MINKFSGNYDIFSNFYPSEIVIRGKSYKTVEHAFQALKAVNKEDREYVRHALTPKEAKSRGRSIKIRADWDSIKISVMEECLKEKFAPGTEFARRLLETGDEQLIEGNTWQDKFWGMCDGEGENHLGRLLMKIRRELKIHGTEKEKESQDSSYHYWT